MITCTRRIEFDAGHRVYRHESKCNNPHGHRYVLEVTAQGLYSEQDDLGRVIDFSVLNEVIGGWVDRHWDHGFLFWQEDPELCSLYGFAGLFHQYKHFCMPTNPTAENIAKYLLFDVDFPELREAGVGLTQIVCRETPNCFATVSR